MRDVFNEKSVLTLVKVAEEKPNKTRFVLTEISCALIFEFSPIHCHSLSIDKKILLISITIIYKIFISNYKLKLGKIKLYVFREQ